MAYRTRRRRPGARAALDAAPVRLGAASPAQEMRSDRIGGSGTQGSGQGIPPSAAPARSGDAGFGV